MSRLMICDKTHMYFYCQKPGISVLERPNVEEIQHKFKTQICEIKKKKKDTYKNLA